MKPDWQVRELEKQGFEVVSVYDKLGKAIDPMEDKSDGYRYFLCKLIDSYPSGPLVAT